MKRLLLLCLLLSTSTVAAQSSGVKVTSPESSCVKAGQQLQAFLSSLNPPREWTWFVICDAKTWSGLAQKMPQIDARTVAYTHFHDRRVFLKLEVFDRDNAQFIVAHELAHIRLGPGVSERRADELARKLLSEKAD